MLTNKKPHHELRILLAMELKQMLVIRRRIRQLNRFAGDVNRIVEISPGARVSRRLLMHGTQIAFNDSLKKICCIRKALFAATESAAEAKGI